MSRNSVYLKDIAASYSGAILSTTIDVKQAAGTYDLFTQAFFQDVLVESVTFYCPVNCSDDLTFTGISIQTDDTTAQEFMDSSDGYKTGLTAQSQLSWTGSTLWRVGQKIQLTIYGGAADDPTVCTIKVKYSMAR